jgi:histidine triad (HIT) family protein
MVGVADCLFCKIVAGEIPAAVVHRTARTLAVRDINPQAKVHVLVLPVDHHEDALELATSAPAVLAEMVAAGASVARVEGIAESGYRLVFNTGEDAGRTVFHAHLHVLGGERLGLFGRHHAAG